jgi:hypothetical protein
MITMSSLDKLALQAILWVRDIVVLAMTELYVEPQTFCHSTRHQ